MATGRLPGQSPGLQVIRWSDAPTAGTTTLSGLDDYSVGLTYTAGYESVYLNGVLLDRGTDYTATNGTTIVLTTATVAGDIVNVFATQISPVNGSLPTSTYTTKGDILVATANNTPVRQGVGADGTVLTANSAQADGVEWAALPGSTIALTPSVTGTYLKRQHSATCSANALAAINTTYYFPVYIGSGTFDRISIISGDSGTGSFPLRLGVYNASSTTGLPSTVLFDAGTVTVNATSTVYEITINQTISKGLYYFAFNAQGSMGTLTMFTAGFSQPLNASSSTTATFAAATNTILGYSQSSVTGAFATAGTLTTSSTASNFALMGMRYA